MIRAHDRRGHAPYQEMTIMTKNEIEKWAKVVKASGARVD